MNISREFLVAACLAGTAIACSRSIPTRKATTAPTSEKSIVAAPAQQAELITWHWLSAHTNSEVLIEGEPRWSGGPAIFGAGPTWFGIAGMNHDWARLEYPRRVQVRGRLVHLNSPIALSGGGMNKPPVAKLDYMIEHARWQVVDESITEPMLLDDQGDFSYASLDPMVGHLIAVQGIIRLDRMGTPFLHSLRNACMIRILPMRGHRLTDSSTILIIGRLELRDVSSPGYLHGGGATSDGSFVLIDAREHEAF